MRSRLTTAAVLLAIVLLFMIQNATLVEVRLLFWEITLRRFLLILVTLLIGIAIGLFLRPLLGSFRRE